MRTVISKEEYESQIRNLELNIAAVLQAINNVIRYQPNALLLNDSEKHVHLIDIQLYLLHMQIDILIGLKNIKRCIYEQNEFEEKYFARVLIMICFETLTKITQLLSSPLNEYRFNHNTIAYMGVIDNYKNELKIIKKRNKDWEEIRNKVIAHRDGNSIWQNQLMKSINSDKLHTDSFNIVLYYSRINKFLLQINKALINRPVNKGVFIMPQ